MAEKEMKCAGPLIEVKDRLHRRWFNLQAYPHHVQTDGISLIDRRAIDDIVGMAEESLDFARDCNGDAGYIAALDGVLNRLKAKLKDSPKTRYTGIVYYQIPKSMASDILTTDINKLINAIHLIGSGFIETSGTHGGCQLITKSDIEEGWGEEGEEPSLKEVNRAAMSYCEGVPPKVGGGRAGLIRENGTTVEHRLGCHSSVVHFTEDEDGYGIRMTYTESGSENWANRMAGMEDVLEDRFGIECDSQGTSAYCKGKLRDPRDFTELAYFLGSIRDVDLLLESCVDEAIAWAASEAAEIVEGKGQDTYLISPYPNDLYQWKEEICNQQDVEEERRTREDETVRQLRHDTTYFQNLAEFRRESMESKPCTQIKYFYAQMANSALEAMRSSCRELSDIGEYTDWCEEGAKDVEKANDEAYRRLIESCPPGTVIKVEEAKHSGITLQEALKPIKKVCTLLDDNSCLQEVKNALERDAAGIKQAQLPISGVY